MNSNGPAKLVPGGGPGEGGLANECADDPSTCLCCMRTRDRKKWRHSPHNECIEILGMGIRSHLFRARSMRTDEMNLYYHPIDKWAYVSPDLMAVKRPLLCRATCVHRIGTTGPAPVLTVEVLSRRSFQQQI